MERIALLLVSDDPGLLRGLRMRLGVEARFVVFAAARSLVEAARLAASAEIDAIVLDLDAGGGAEDVLATARTLATRHPVVVLGLQDSPGFAARVLDAGAGAYVRKHDGVSRLIAAIDSAVAQRGEGGAMPS